MGFPKALLADHEKLVFDLKEHWVSLMPPVLWTLGLLAVWVLGYQVAERTMDDPAGVQNGVAIVALVVWAIVAVVPFLRWQFRRFVLTSDRLITRAGIIAKHSKEIPLERINDVAFNQTVLERVLGAGDLLVESAGERGQTLITNVRKPEQVQLMIYKEIEANTNRMMPGSGGPPGVPEQIEALARLVDQGLLTEAEFEAKKEQLLKRM